MASDIDSQQDEQKITEMRKFLIKQKQQIQGYHIQALKLGKLVKKL